MTTSFWLRWRWLLRLWILLVATTSIPPAIFAYDEKNQTTVAYDSSGESAAGYDAISVLVTDEKESGATGERVPFAKFAKFLAAETTAVQLEFSFARGASIQTPGVTMAGETFVRVGAVPENLNFGLEALSGARPRTFAFPEATFNSIGQTPAALQNFGDLPGAAPQYFRVLRPPQHSYSTGNCSGQPEWRCWRRGRSFLSKRILV